MARMLRPLQNTGRSGTKHTSERVGHRARDAKNKQKSAQQLPGQRFLLRAHDNEVLERSGADFCQGWTSPGRLLGGSWALLGRSRALLATSWAHLGHIFGALGPLLAANCSPRWARARFFIDLGWILAPFGAPFGGVAPRFWEGLGHPATGLTWCAHFCRKPVSTFTQAFFSPPAARRYVRSTWN